MIIQNCNGKAIYVSLLFPKLGENVKKIDIVAYPHKDDVHRRILLPVKEQHILILI